MNHTKKISILSFLTCALFLFSIGLVTSQEQAQQLPPTPPQQEQSKQAPNEREQLREKQTKEREELRNKLAQGKKEAREKQIKERQEAKEKLRKKREKELLVKGKVKEQWRKNKATSTKLIKEYNEKILNVKKRGKFIEVITNENDPVYILDARILKTRTDFLGIKDVEYKYRVRLHNQTPKIINSLLLAWERKIPFIDTQTIAKEFRVSKPITPYEKRVVDYNEIDSKRNGESYKVKIIRVIFEDGSQWKNPGKNPAAKS